MNFLQSIIDLVDGFFGSLSNAFDRLIGWLKDLFGLPDTGAKAAE